MISTETKAAFDSASQYFAQPIQQFQYFDKYSRFDYTKGRRETWPETCDRAVTFLRDLIRINVKHLSMKEINELAEQVISEAERQSLLNMQALPSMRTIAMAGDAASRQNACTFNCSFLPICDTRAYAEALLISMSGCGVGFSVEKKYVDQLPAVAKQHARTEDLAVHVVEDSTEGWCRALLLGLNTWFGGGDIDFDLTGLRPAGAVLRIKGGRASGPRPLAKLLAFARKTILSRQGGRLTPLDAHDIMCAVGDAAVCGGHRRTAMISLYDRGDVEMRAAKNGADFPDVRWNANNSEAWGTEPLSDLQLLQQMVEMFAGERGEPGIFSRRAAKFTLPTRRKWCPDFGVNPCGEIILRPYGFCNLSIVVARADDTLQTLLQKVRTAAIFGTVQSLATHFPGLRDEWRQNAVEERLLGVDITGQADCPLLRDESVLYVLREAAVEQNRITAAQLGINPAAAVTCVKPSGNSSQLLGCSSGLHPRHAEYYIRNVRVSAHSPVYQVLRDANVLMSPENGQDAATATTWVVGFPVHSPAGSVLRKDASALDALEGWKKSKLFWCEHNPSVTITYKPDEMIGIVAWLRENQDIVGGLSFLPYSDAKYAQMPYTEVTREEYEARVAAFPAIDWSRIALYETDDQTEAAQNLACVSGQCDI